MIQTVSSRAAVFQSLTKITGLSDGAFAVAGRVTDGLRSGADLAVLEPRWRVAWAVRLIGAEIHALLPTGDGGFIAALTARVPEDNPLLGQYGPQPPALAHFDRSGRRTWLRVVAFEKKTAVIKSLALAPGGGFYAAGHIVGPRAKYYRSRADNRRYEPFIMRTDASGNLVWLKTIQTGKDQGVEVLDVLAKADDVFVVGRGAVFRIGVTGALNWMLEIPEGTIWNAALVEGGIVLGGSRTDAKRGRVDGLAISVNSSGGIRWAITVNASPSDRVEHIATLPDGGVVLTGFTRRMGPTLEDKIHRRDGWLAAIDSKGHPSWSYTFGGPFDDHLNAAAASSKVVGAVGSLGTETNHHRFIASLALEPASSEATCSGAVPINTTVASLEIEAHQSRASLNDLPMKTTPFELVMEPLELAIRLQCPD